MLPTSFEELENVLSEKYNHEDKKVIGIMFARYDKSSVKELIAQNYEYWHINTKNDFHIAWIGYTYDKYSRNGGLCDNVREINNQNIYFDRDDYTESKNDLRKRYKIIKRENFEFILVNYYDGQLHFNENIRIDLSQNQDNIDRIMDLVTDICSESTNIKQVKRKLFNDKFMKTVKGIKFENILKGALEAAIFVLNKFD